MRRFSFRLTLITLLAGVLGAVLRHFELLTAFDADGLAKPWAPLTILMALFTAAYAVFLFFSIRRLKDCTAPEGYEAAFSYRSPVKLIFQILCGLLLFAVAIVSFMSARTRNVFGDLSTQPEVGVVGILAAISGVCVLMLSVASYRKENRGGLPFCALAPVLLYCFLLTVLYKNRAADPIIRDYVYELFSICAALLALFFAAGSACSRPRPKRTVFFSQLGMFFSLITLADGHELWMSGIYLFSSLWLLFTGYSYLKNLEQPHRYVTLEELFREVSAAQKKEEAASGPAPEVKADVPEEDTPKEE